jgi:hypothetical protein
MSPRALGVVGVVLLGAGLGVLATLVPRPDAEPVAETPAPPATAARSELARDPRPGTPAAAQDGAARRPSEDSTVVVLVRRADGKPVPGARVSRPRARLPGGDAGEEESAASATTDATGRAEVRATERRGVWLATLGGEVGIGMPEAWAEPDAVEITLGPPAAAEVDVVDPTGRPVANASVSALLVWSEPMGVRDFLRARDGGIVASGILAAWSARTDASGSARFPSLPPSDWQPDRQILGAWAARRVLVEAEGFRSAHSPLADGPSRVVLTPAVEYRARVVDEDGRALHDSAWTCGPDVRGWGDREGRLVALVPDADLAAAPPPLVIDANGFLARTFERTTRAPAVVDLGTVALRPAVLLRGVVVHADGTPAGGVLVTADHESRERVFVQGLTGRDGAFALEPPAEGLYRIGSGTAGAPQRGSTRGSLWEAFAEHVRPGEERRLVLRFVPGLLVRLVPPDPRPPGFSLDNVTIVPRSADGRGQYDWMPEDGGRYLVRLLGRGPWRVEVRHADLEPVDFEVHDLPPGPSDEVLTREVALRAASR